MTRIVEITDKQNYKAKTPCPFCGSKEINKGKITVTGTISHLILVDQAVVSLSLEKVPVCAKCKAIREEEDIQKSPLEIQEVIRSITC